MASSSTFVIFLKSDRWNLQISEKGAISALCGPRDDGEKVQRMIYWSPKLQYTVVEKQLISIETLWQQPLEVFIGPLWK